MSILFPFPLNIFFFTYILTCPICSMFFFFSSCSISKWIECHFGMFYCTNSSLESHKKSLDALWFERHTISHCLLVGLLRYSDDYLFSLFVPLHFALFLCHSCFLLKFLHPPSLLIQALEIVEVNHFLSSANQMPTREGIWKILEPLNL